MSTIHPDWQSDEGRPVRVTVKPSSANAAPEKAPAPAQQMRKIKTVSRKPAAFVGIALALATVFAVFRPDIGGSTTGQAQSSYKIVLTPDGAIPDRIVAAPGDQIEFLNSFEDPQSVDLSLIPTIEKADAILNGLYDETLPWITPPIPFGGSYVTTIDYEAERGEYVYSGVGDTADLILGSVSVEYFSDENMNLPGEDEEFPAEEPLDEEPLFPDMPVDEQPIDDEPTFEELYPYDESIFGSENDENVFQLPAEVLPTDEAVPVSYPQQNLPQNPFTVEYGQVRGSPVPPPYQGFTPQEETHAGAPLNQPSTRPISQPATGAGHWVIILLSIGAVLATTRKAFRTV